ncbi:MAG: DUF5397 family protein [Candidatus Competibacteraceae bacterium]|uniref:Uncharacterized protein n=1 Tax=Candidatus Contendobacter odensis Run_B_J11 TaxID=1400861 RepID=A0A7U7GAX9_9GAMM|nr:DUF5397 family protein [Candidatus Contendobacter odensis]MBK8535249.1 DUF5397 family protein [Candidatus Competibacteraceae bacterium]MBK8752899.1 DUF5397 family protein [Candidatus Competibacteraceae bacterium]CDH44813.1 conserved hypothetical protein [Candidatus Contendobacter odensis Run_B_J11]
MLHIEPQSLIGTWRRFGLSGPVYEIVSEGKKLHSGDETVRVRVIETGEELDYKLADVLDDPKER